MFAVSVGNSGRAIPELALIALVVAFIGFGFLNVAIALMVLGIPPILTNAYRRGSGRSTGARSRRRAEWG